MRKRACPILNTGIGLFRFASLTTSLFVLVSTLSVTGGLAQSQTEKVVTTTLDGKKDAEKEAVILQYGKVPAFFIENKGQTDNKVKYYFKGNDNVYFTDEGVMFQKTVKESKSQRVEESGVEESGVGAGLPRPHKADEPASVSSKTLAYKLEFVGAKIVSPQARDELKGKVNYLIGNDRSKWHSNIPTYQEIVYPGLYPPSLVQSSSIGPNVSVQAASLNQQEAGGIDLVYRGVPGGMKYEFIVQPGADPKVIRLAYTGIEGLSIDDAGNLIIHTSLGDVKDTKPYCYQEIDGKQVEVDGTFVILKEGGWHGQTCLSVLNEGKTTTPQSPPSQGGDKGEVFVQKCLFPLYQEGIKGCVVNPQFIYGFTIASYNIQQSLPPHH